MYKVGEVVLYGANGVCEITEITTKTIGKISLSVFCDKIFLISSELSTSRIFETSCSLCVGTKSVEESEQTGFKT